MSLQAFEITKTEIVGSLFTVTLLLLSTSLELPISSATLQSAETTSFNYVVNPNKTCGENYKTCIDEVNIDNVVELSRDSYIDACNKTLQCTSMYFECRMARDNSTSSESPLEYSTFKIKSFMNTFQTFFK